MATPELAIAKASFSAALLRPDPTPCSRDDIEQFHALLAVATGRCSPANVQSCKQWALQYLVQSATRVAALGKYLAALSNSFKAGDALSKQSRVPSVKRRRLHLLYVLNDILYHVLVRDHKGSFAAALESAVPALFRSAAAFQNSHKQIKKLNDLIGIWEEERYFEPSLISRLRSIVEDGPRAVDSDRNGTEPEARGTADPLNKAKDAPFVMPAQHGDPSTPWYDLPAGNWLPVIEPNSTRPMNPTMIKPLQFASRPAERDLVEVVKKLLVDVDRIYAKDARSDGDASFDIDQMGQRVEIDEITGGILGGDTYYGWSKPFCEKMKRRAKNGTAPGRDEQRGRLNSSRSSSRSRTPSRRRGGQSRSSERPAFKRRRLSSSRSRSRSRTPVRSRSQSRSRGYHKGESRDKPRRRGRSRSPRSDSRSRSREGYRADSPPGRSRYSGGNSYEEERSTSQQYARPHQAGRPPPFHPPPPNLAPRQQQGFIPMPPQIPPQAYAGFPAVPPPPPPNFQGQWAPPPFPMANQAPAPPQPWFPPTAAPLPTPPAGWATGGWANPAGAPVPPPPVGQQHPQYGRGGNQNYQGQGGGRGWSGYGRGRGW